MKFLVVFYSHISKFVGYVLSTGIWGTGFLRTGFLKILPKKGMLHILFHSYCKELKVLPHCLQLVSLMINILCRI